MRAKFASAAGKEVDITDAEAPATEEEATGEARLTNGDEAANFFARNGNNTPVKFVYLNRARTGDEFRPYDLAVVSREQTTPSTSRCRRAAWCTFSRGAEAPSEFIQLSTWMQQSTFFNVLTSIRFFRHYLAAKIFRLWRANVRYKLYVAQRNKLCKKLFLAKPAFCSTLLEINALCYELRTERQDAAHSRPSRQLHPIDNFPRGPAAVPASPTKAFEQIVDKLQALVEKVCKDVTTRARIVDDNPLRPGRSASRAPPPARAPSEALVERWVRESRARRRKQPRRHPARHKAMSQEKEEQNARIVGRVRQAPGGGAAARRLHPPRRLHGASPAATCSLSRCEKLLECSPTPRARTACGSRPVEYGDNSHDLLAAAPMRRSPRRSPTMLELMVNNIHAVPRLLYMRPFKPYFHSGRVEGPDVAKLVRNATSWIKMQGEIEQVIVEDFERRRSTRSSSRSTASSTSSASTGTSRPMRRASSPPRSRSVQAFKGTWRSSTSGSRTSTG